MNNDESPETKRAKNFESFLRSQWDDDYGEFETPFDLDEEDEGFFAFSYQEPEVCDEVEAKAFQAAYSKIPHGSPTGPPRPPLTRHGLSRRVLNPVLAENRQKSSFQGALENARASQSIRPSLKGRQRPRCASGRPHGILGRSSPRVRNADSADGLSRDVSFPSECTANYRSYASRVRRSLDRALESYERNEELNENIASLSQIEAEGQDVVDGPIDEEFKKKGKPDDVVDAKPFGQTYGNQPSAQGQAFTPAQGQVFDQAQGQAFIQGQGHVFGPAEGQGFIQGQGHVFGPAPGQAFGPTQGPGQFGQVPVQGPSSTSSMTESQGYDVSGHMAQMSLQNATQTSSFNITSTGQQTDPKESEGFDEVDIGDSKNPKGQDSTDARGFRPTRSEPPKALKPDVAPDTPDLVSQDIGSGPASQPMSLDIGPERVAEPISQDIGPDIAPQPMSWHSIPERVAEPISQDIGPDIAPQPMSWHSGPERVAEPISQDIGPDIAPQPMSWHSGPERAAEPISLDNGPEAHQITQEERGYDIIDVKLDNPELVALDDAINSRLNAETSEQGSNTEPSTFSATKSATQDSQVSEGHDVVSEGRDEGRDVVDAEPLSGPEPPQRQARATVVPDRQHRRYRNVRVDQRIFDLILRGERLEAFGYRGIFVPSYPTDEVNNIAGDINFEVTHSSVEVGYSVYILAQPDFSVQLVEFPYNYDERLLDRGVDGFRGIFRQNMNVDRVHQCMGVIEELLPGQSRTVPRPPQRRCSVQGNVVRDSQRRERIEPRLLYHVTCNSAAVEALNRKQENFLIEEEVETKFDLECGNSSCFDDLEWNDYSSFDRSGFKKRKQTSLVDDIINAKPTNTNPFHESMMIMKRRKARADIGQMMQEFDPFDEDALKLSPIEDRYRLDYLPGTERNFENSTNRRADESLSTLRLDRDLTDLQKKMSEYATPFIDRLVKLDKAIKGQKQDLSVFMEHLNKELSNMEAAIARISNMVYGNPKKPTGFPTPTITRGAHELWCSQYREEWIQYLRIADKAGYEIDNFLRRWSHKKLIPDHAGVRSRLTEAVEARSQGQSSHNTTSV